MTAPSALLGSPLYMSPEQLRSSHDADDRTDIWALGVIMFELLAGAPPFDAGSMAELAVSIAASPPRSLRALRPDVPPLLESVVMRCLAKYRAHRFANVADLAIALGPLGPASSALSVDRIYGVIYHGRAGSTPPPPAPPRAPLSSSPPARGSGLPPPTVQSTHPPRRLQRGAGIALGALLLATAAAALVVGVIARRPPPPSAPTNAPPAARPPPTMLEVAAPAPAPSAELRARVIGRKGSVLTIAKTAPTDPSPPPGQRGTLSRETRGDAGATWTLVADVSVLARPGAAGVTVLELPTLHRDAPPLPLNTAVKLEWSR